MKKILLITVFLFVISVPRTFAQWTYQDSNNLQNISWSLQRIQNDNQIREMNRSTDEYIRRIHEDTNAEIDRNRQHQQYFHQTILQAVPDYYEIINSPNFQRKTDSSIFCPFTKVRVKGRRKHFWQLVPRQPDQAIQCLLQYKKNLNYINAAINAAKNGDEEAAIFMAKQYYGKDSFFQQNYVYAYAWYLVAQKNSKEIPSGKKTIQPYVSESSRVAAIKMAKRFFKNGYPPGGYPK